MCFEVKKQKRHMIVTGCDEWGPKPHKDTFECRISAWADSAGIRLREGDEPAAAFAIKDRAARLALADGLRHAADLIDQTCQDKWRCACRPAQ